MYIIKTLASFGESLNPPKNAVVFALIFKKKHFGMSKESFYWGDCES
jgi:hypothetical protein